MKTLISAAVFIARAIGQDIIHPCRHDECEAEHAARHRAGRNGMLICLLLAILLLAAKCHGQHTFNPVPATLTFDPIHLSPGDTAPGVDPARGFGSDNLPEATEERFMALGGILFASAYLWAYWHGKKQKH